MKSCIHFLQRKPRQNTKEDGHDSPSPILSRLHIPNDLQLAQLCSIAPSLLLPLTFHLSPFTRSFVPTLHK